MPNPKVSICIPAYNRQEYLVEAIESVLKQTFSDFELIISDDFSPIDLRTVVSVYKDKRIKYFRQEKNLGFIKNWNFCLCQSRGEYIKIMGDDDVLLNNCIEVQLKNLEENNEGLVYSNLLIIDENGKNRDDINNNNEYRLFVGDRVIKSRDFLKMFFLEKIKVGLPTASLFRRSIINEIGFFDENLGSSVDSDMWLRMMAISNFSYSDTLAVKCRIHPENLSKKLINDNISLRGDLAILYKHKNEVRKFFLFEKFFIFKKYFYIIRKQGSLNKIIKNTFDLFLFLFL